jgi:hypothetical protein
MNFSKLVSMILESPTEAEYEAKNYTAPPARGKFQKGDLVIPILNYDLSKKARVYVGQVGRIVSYKLVPGSYSSYTIKFADGNLEAYKGQNILGPFASEEVADKYASAIASGEKVRDKDIKIEDRKPKEGSKTEGGKLALESRPDIESSIREIFCNNTFRMQWLDEPLQFYVGGKRICSVIAMIPKEKTSFKDVKDYDKSYSRIDEQFQDLCSSHYLVARTNNVASGKLVSYTFDRLFNDFYRPHYFLKRANNNSHAVEATDYKYFLLAPSTQFLSAERANEIGARSSGSNTLLGPDALKLNIYALTTGSLKNATRCIEYYDFLKRIYNNDKSVYDEAVFETFGIHMDGRPSYVDKLVVQHSQLQLFQNVDCEKLTIADFDPSLPTPAPKSVEVLTIVGDSKSPILNFNFLNDFKKLKVLNIHQVVIRSKSKIPITMKDFVVYSSEFQTLDFFPTKIDGRLSIRYCGIGSGNLQGCTQEGIIDFDCVSTKLTSLKGGPMEVDGTYDCSGNPDLVIKDNDLPLRCKRFISDQMSQREYEAAVKTASLRRKIATDDLNDTYKRLNIPSDIFDSI